MKQVLIAIVVVGLSASGVVAQRGRGAAPTSAAKNRSVSVRVAVRDQDGASLDGVRITLSGDASGEFTTAGAGIVILSNVKDGTYRAHCERDGFITLEREFSVQAGTPAAIDIVLTRQP